jgi:S-adenosyl methyltransferase
VYVDYDPVVITHAKTLLAGSDTVTVVQADLRRPAEIVAAAAETLDFGKPVAVLLVAILHFVSDEENPRASSASYVTRWRLAATWSSRTPPTRRPRT